MSDVETFRVIWSLILVCALAYGTYGVIELWAHRRPKKKVAAPPPAQSSRARHDELLDLAVERLAGLGTERGERLAMEIQRGRQREHNDEAVLRALGGANFGPNASVKLPSGRVLDADEAQALTSFYGPPARHDQPEEGDR